MQKKPTRATACSSIGSSSQNNHKNKKSARLRRRRDINPLGSLPLSLHFISHTFSRISCVHEELTASSRTHSRTVLLLITSTKVYIHGYLCDEEYKTVCLFNNFHLTTILIIHNLILMISLLSCMCIRQRGFKTGSRDSKSVDFGIEINSAKNWGPF